MNNNRLWYNKPAGEWKEGLPIGTGRLAAMILGGAPKERIALNHEWLSSGYHVERHNEDKTDYLPRVRKLIEEENYGEASLLANEAWGGGGGISGKPSSEDPYKPFGDLYIELDHGKVENYKRELNLDDDLVTISYDADGKKFTRRYLAHLVKDILIVNINAGGETFSANAYFTRVEEEGVEVKTGVAPIEDLDLLFESEGIDSSNIDIAPNGAFIRMDGEFTGGGLKFTGLCVADCKEGQTAILGDRLTIRDTKELTLYINMGTSYNKKAAKFPRSPIGECLTTDVKSGDIDAVIEENIKEYRAHYGRLSLDIKAENNEYEALPTDERIIAYRNFVNKEDNPAIKAGLIDDTDNIDGKSGIKLDTDDVTMPLLYFNYGRYLLTASSANGELPANLQGKWNEDIYPAWDCDYHNDINIQMNYWPAEAGHLQEYMSAFFTYLEKLTESGKEAAMKLFGCRGVWIPLCSDAWGQATPETYGWSVWCSVAAWFAEHVWWHYEYSQDIEFLKNEGYPFLKEVASFYEDFLVKDADGVYQIVPSQSPENHFEGGGEMPVTICKSSAVDIELADEALEHAIMAAKELNVDEELTHVWAELRENLPKLQIGSKGQLLEWNKEFTESEPHHRHISHLIGLYPGDRIDRYKTPELFEAAAKSLDLRLKAGGGYTGWSRAWTACVFARMGNGTDAWEHLRSLIGDYATESLLDLHPPRIFQIDGNLGGTAAMLEMILQSYYGIIDILPALPPLWKEGCISGIRARGGYTMDIAWADSKLTEASLVSIKDRQCSIRVKDNPYKITDDNGAEVENFVKDGIQMFDCKAGIKYHIKG
ncbi:MAG: glycoside hydrolase N-terminal domain-containing protein [Lachnospiraceae bacterium]|nr:glycoside hydrolase N-terminal domain-containing protein [Lachnospiraceae bacterium]